MKICFLLQDRGRVYGAERATLDLAEGLLPGESSSCELILIEEERLDMAHSDLLQDARERGLRVSTLKTPSRLSLRLVRAIREATADADILHVVGYKATVHAALARGGGAQPALVSTVHGWLFRPDVKERFYGWVERVALRHCDKVIALSTFYEQILRDKGIPPERTIRIPSGLDRQAIARLGAIAAEEPGDRSFTVGLMGRLSWEKNHVMLLKAVYRLKQMGINAQCRLAGDGPERTAIQRHVRELDLSQDVQLIGYVDREEFLREIDVLVLCSTIENMPYSIMEAMAAGLPVVASRAGGMPDMIEDGETGYLVPPGNVEVLAERLAQLAGDGRKRAAFGRSAMAKVAREYALEQTVQAHTRLYADVAGDRPRG